MLVPTSSILSAGHHVPSIIGSANPLMYPPPSVSHMGKYDFIYKCRSTCVYIWLCRGHKKITSIYYTARHFPLEFNELIVCGTSPWDVRRRKKWILLKRHVFTFDMGTVYKCHGVILRSNSICFIANPIFYFWRNKGLFIWFIYIIRIYIFVFISILHWNVWLFCVCIHVGFPFFFRASFVYARIGPRLATNYPPPPNVGFMHPSILAASGTLRRPRVEYDSAAPRILSKIDIEPQFYYGWPLLNNRMLASPSSTDTTLVSGTSSPKLANTIAMQKIERTGTPTLSTSSPTSTLTKKPNHPQTSTASGNEHSNKNTVVLCPPSRTYCF